MANETDTPLTKTTRPTTSPESGAFGQTSETPAIGEYKKILLPGETPWAECVAIEPDGSWHGRIANKLFTEYDDRTRDEIAGFGPQIDPLPRLHNFKQDDVVRLVWRGHLDPLRRGWIASETPGGRA